MIWRLAHPVRGMAAAFALWVLALLVIGFGIGIAELALLTAASVVVVVLAGRSSVNEA